MTTMMMTNIITIDRRHHLEDSQDGRRTPRKLLLLAVGHLALNSRARAIDRTTCD